eukprot:486002_1
MTKKKVDADNERIRNKNKGKVQMSDRFDINVNGIQNEIKPINVCKSWSFSKLKAHIYETEIAVLPLNASHQQKILQEDFNLVGAVVPDVEHYEKTLEQLGFKPGTSITSTYATREPTVFKINIINKELEPRTFDLNITAMRGRMYKIENVTKETTVADVKSKFLAEVYYQSADQYNQGNYKVTKVVLGKDMEDGKTLGYYGIVNGIHLPLVVKWKVKGYGK